MKYLIPIASIMYVLMLGIYFTFGDSDVIFWDIFHASTGALLIISFYLDKVLNTKRLLFVSIYITSLIFQILFVVFLIYLGIIAEDHTDMVRMYVSYFWSLIGVFLVIAFFIVNILLQKWISL